MPIPEGFAAVTPFVFVDGTEAYLHFLRQALAVEELGRSTAPDGRIANCQMRISGATIMLAEASEAFPASRAAFYLYVEDAEAAMLRARRAGAEVIMEIGDMDYGDRQGGVRDPAGNIWWISQRLVAGPYY
ncbi:VOC family protein [Pararhodobacter oceanensis]|uniref:VOC family protein n=1 Tax=Pararhodobacter oceanensis TaxID=2172121 RepID=UPI003A8CC53D